MSSSSLLFSHPSAAAAASLLRQRCSCSAGAKGNSKGVGPTQLEADLLHQAARLADKSAGQTSPNPNFGCLIAVPGCGDSAGRNVVGEGFLYAQGTKCAELQAVEMAGELARGATAYLNMEPGDCYGDNTPVSSLIQVLIPIPQSQIDTIQEIMKLRTILLLLA